MLQLTGEFHPIADSYPTAHPVECISQMAEAVNPAGDWITLFEGLYQREGHSRVRPASSIARPRASPRAPCKARPAPPE